MTSTTIRVAAAAPSNVHRKLTLLAGDGTQVWLPFAPIESPIAGLADRWVEVDRDGGRAPLLVWAGPQLSTVTFEATVTNTRDPFGSVEGFLTQLAQISRQQHPVFVLNYSTAGIAYRIIDFAAAPFTRTIDNKVAGFTASLTLKVNSDGRPATGPVTGGARSLAGSSSAQLRTTGAVRVASPRSVTVQAGETATGAVIRALGSSDRLVDVLDLNGIRDPRRAAAGTVLRLPT